jgi:acyl-CoA dehydrogenase
MHAQSSKVYCTETAFKVASEGMQIHGAYGLSKGYPIEKMLRDARASMIGEENNALSLVGAPLMAGEAKC